MVKPRLAVELPMYGEPSFEEDLQKLLDKYTMDEILELNEISPLVVLMILVDYGFNQLLEDDQSE